MDETSLARHVSGLTGTVVKTPTNKCQLGEVATLHERRSYITYLATITHDPEVQPRLPQVLIGSHRQFTATVVKDVSFLPSNVYMWRCKSAWNSHLLMRRYLSLLASSLGSVLKERYVILILDVARCHLHPTILAHAKRCRIRLCFIPALMTAELQPCDTHLFARFKATFREHWRRQKALSAKLGWTSAPLVPEGLPSVETASLVNVQAYVSWGCHAASQMNAFEASRRRPLPPTFKGTVDHPLTID